MSNAPGERPATDMDARLGELERQVRGFRRSVRHQRFAIGGMAVLLVMLLVGGAGQPGDAGKVVDELRVKRLSIIDDKGKVRISAATNPDGAASLSWFDRDGRPRIVAAALQDGGAAVSWLDRDEKIRIDASTDQNGRAHVAWFDRDGKGRILASTERDGSVSLPITDLKGKP